MSNCCYSFILISSILFASCSKDKVGDKQFTIGDSEKGNVTVTSFSPALNISSSSNGGLIADTIDFYLDGIKDLAIETYGFHWANIRSSRIVYLSDKVKILCIQAFDTIKLTSQNLNPLVNSDSVSYNTYSGFDSGQLNDIALSTSIDYYPQQLKYGSTGFINNTSNKWQNIGLLSSYINGYYYTSPNLFHYGRKGNWNNAGVKYLCIKLDREGEIKYGWIKLEVNYELSVRILEYAIQN